MGQRFLVSRPVLTKIIAAADLKPTDIVLEIGPGRGELTFALAERAGQVIAVEKDKRFFNLFKEKLERSGTTNIRLIHGDILRLFESKKQEPMNSEQDRKRAEDRGLAHCSLLPAYYRVVANIPYYLTSRLIRKLLETEHPPKDILLMVQKEVAERITAKPPKMNLLALSVQAYARPKILFPVPASAFSPPPKVASALIIITGISNEFFSKNRIAPERFFALARAAFAGKRKILTNSLARLAGGKDHARALIKKSGLPEWARPEELSLDDWVRLTRASTLRFDPSGNQRGGLPMV